MNALLLVTLLFVVPFCSLYIITDIVLSFYAVWLMPQPYHSLRQKLIHVFFLFMFIGYVTYFSLARVHYRYYIAALTMYTTFVLCGFIDHVFRRGRFLTAMLRINVDDRYPFIIKWLSQLATWPVMAYVICEGTIFLIRICKYNRRIEKENASLREVFRSRMPEGLHLSYDSYLQQIYTFTPQEYGQLMEYIAFRDVSDRQGTSAHSNSREIHGLQYQSEEIPDHQYSKSKFKMRVQARDKHIEKINKSIKVKGIYPTPPRPNNKKLRPNKCKVHVQTMPKGSISVQSEEQDYSAFDRAVHVEDINPDDDADFDIRFADYLDRVFGRREAAFFGSPLSSEYSDVQSFTSDVSDYDVDYDTDTTLGYDTDTDDDESLCSTDVEDLLENLTIQPQSLPQLDIQVWLKDVRKMLPEGGDTDSAIKIAERLILCSYQLYAAPTWVYAISVLYTHLSYVMDKSAVEQVIAVINVIFPEIETQSGDSAFDQLKAGMEHWQSFKTGDLVKKVTKIMGLMMAVGLCTRAGVKHDPTEMGDAFQFPSATTSISLVEHAVNLFVFVYERLQLCFQAKSLSPLLLGDNASVALELRYAKATALYQTFTTGSLSCEYMGQDAMTAQEYMILLERLVCDLEHAMRGCPPGPMRLNLSRKLERIQSLAIGVRIPANMQAMRQKPLGILLFGKSGMAKSAMMTILATAIAKANNWPIGPDTIGTLNLQDKYDSVLTSAHMIVLMDELCNTLAAKSPTVVTQRITDVFNNVMYMLLKADVDSKGKTPLLAKLVIGTTNVRDLQANEYSNNPVSILRRFEYHIEVKVKAEFAAADTGMIDPAKMVDPINDAWVFTVNKIIPKRSSIETRVDEPLWVPVTWNGEVLHEISLSKLIQFLVTESKMHYAMQARLLEHQVSIYDEDMCEHDTFKCLCPTCSIVVQADEVDDEFTSYGRKHGVCYYVPQSFGCDRLHEWLRQRDLFTVKATKLVCFNLCACTIATMSACIVGPFWFLFATMYGITYYMTRLAFVMTQRWYMLRRLSRLPLSQLRNLYVHRPKAIKIVGVLGLVVAIGYMFVRCQKLAKVVVNVQSHDEEVEMPKSEKIDPWAKIHVERAEVSIAAKTASFEDICGLVASKLLAAELLTLRNGVPSKSFCSVLPVCKNFILVPHHILLRNPHSIVVAKHVAGIKGMNFECQITARMWKRLGDSDIAVLYVPKMYPVRDIRKFFANKQNYTPNAAMWIHRNEELEVMTENVRLNGQITYPIEDVTHKGMHYKLGNRATRSGMCGAAVVVNSKDIYIYGIHVAGKNGEPLGVCQQVLRGELDAAIEDLVSNPASIVCQSASRPDIEDYGAHLKCILIPDAHEHSYVNYIPQDQPVNVVYMGHHTGHRVRGASSVESTLLSKSVEQHTGQEPLYGPPKNFNHPYIPHRDELLGVVNPVIPDTVLVEMAYNDMRLRHEQSIIEQPDMLKHVKVISLPHAINGYAGVLGFNSIDMSTSSGHPENTCKRKFFQESTDEVVGIERNLELIDDYKAKLDHMENELASGVRPHIVFKMNKKDEAKKLSSEKVRIFASSPFLFTILMRKYYLSILLMMRQYRDVFEGAIGINAHGPEWSEMWESFLTFPDEETCHTSKNITGDYQKFDTRTYALLIMLGFKLMILIAIKAGYKQRDIDIMWAIASIVAYPLYDVNGDICGTIGGMPSGHIATVQSNGLSNGMHMRIAWYDSICNAKQVFDEKQLLDEDYYFHKHVKLVTYGDDSAQRVSNLVPWYNHTSIQNSLAKYDLVFTMADKEAISRPYVLDDELSFLKRSVVWCQDKQLYMGPLDEDSIFKSLHVAKRSKELTKEQHAAEILQGAMREWFLYGQSVYNMRLEQMSRVAQECHIDIFLENGSLRTWEQAQQAYVETYSC